MRHCSHLPSQILSQQRQQYEPYKTANTCIASVSPTYCNLHPKQLLPRRTASVACFARSRIAWGSWEQIAWDVSGRRVVARGRRPRIDPAASIFPGGGGVRRSVGADGGGLPNIIQRLPNITHPSSGMSLKTRIVPETELCIRSKVKRRRRLNKNKRNLSLKSES